MSRNGVWQLRKINIQFCDWGGSSAGIRKFLETHLPEFQQKNPQIMIEVNKKRNKHPHLCGLYINGRKRPLSVRNMDPDQIMYYLNFLRDQWGYKTRSLGQTQKITERPSIQGYWNPFTKYD